jgi:hypothetical protein
MHLFALRKPWALIAPAVAALALVLALLTLGRGTGAGRPVGHGPSAHTCSCSRLHGSRSSTPHITRAGGGDGSVGSGSTGAGLIGAEDASAAIPTLLPSPRPTGTPVSVTLAPGPAGPAAPADFLGLSFELRSLPLLARYAAESASGTARAAPTNPAIGPANGERRRTSPGTSTGKRQAGLTTPAGGDLVALLRSLGPGVLRFGGASADEQVAWLPERASIGGGGLPRWATTALDAHDLAGIAMLARETGWRVLLTVNLGHYDPTAAAREAAAARAALGPALAGIELGNEPDRYAGKHLRAPGWDLADYGRQTAAYRAAIEAAAPGVALAAPDAGTGPPGLPWVRFAVRALHPQLLTDHYYPLSSCGYRPTVGELLSPTVRLHERAMLAMQAAIARAAATPLRVDEANSISCEGRPGVSDTFASALWALDYTAHALAAGVAGVNFHDLLDRPGAYSPLVAPNPAALAAGALRAQPEWYALLAARQLSGSQPLSASVAGAAGQSSIANELSASAFRAPDGRLRLVLVDYDPPGSRPLAVHLEIPGRAAAAAHLYRSGGILRLTGSSPSATAGVELGGRAVTAAGAWTPPPALPAVYARAGALSVQMDPSSAAVVTLYPG